MQIKIAVITAASMATMFVAVPAAFATDAMTTTTRTTASPNPVRTEIQGLRKDLQGDRQQAAGLRSDILTKSCAMIETNATNLMAKIQARITVAQGQGKDVSAAVAALATANTDLTNGKSYCDQAVAKFNSVPADKWSEQYPVMVQARALAKQAKTSFMKLRVDLQTAVKAIRGLGLPEKAKVAASPTTAVQQ